MSVVSGQGGAFCFTMQKTVQEYFQNPKSASYGIFHLGQYTDMTLWGSTIFGPVLHLFGTCFTNWLRRVMNFITHLIKLDWSNFGQTNLIRFIDTAGASRIQRMCLHCPPQILTCRVTHAPWSIPLLIIYPLTYLQALDISKWSYIGSASQAIQNLYHKSLQSLPR